MFSILILTKNEEINLAACLDSVKWCDDVIVLDSISEDSTCEVAKDSGARVFSRPFDDFGTQRNFALDHIPFKHPWVFHLDADERFNESLRFECERVINEDVYSAFFVPNRIIFLGKWIKHSTQYPYPQVRLLKVGELRFSKSGHGQREEYVKRGLGHIKIGYDHYNFSKGIGDWVSKHNRYSDAEVEDLIHLKWNQLDWKGLLSFDKMRRKRSMKLIHALIPFRWIAKFVFLYFLKRGFLDGYPGFLYCILQTAYDFLIVVKLSEKRLTQCVKK